MNPSDPTVIAHPPYRRRNATHTLAALLFSSFLPAAPLNVETCSDAKSSLFKDSLPITREAGRR